MGNKVRIDAELNDGVTRKLNGISRAFDRLGGPGSGASLFGNVGAKAIATGFNLIADAASAAVGFAFDSIDAFSDLQQAAGGVDAVFGKARDTIDAFAETAAEKAGLSKRAVFEMATVIGAKLKGMGMDVDEAASTVVTLEQRAADMAATFGGTTVEAIQAISSALTGERDPIEKYGLSIKEADVQARILAMDLPNVTAEEKKAATAAATLDLIMQGTSDTTGKFAAEADQLAGKQQIANAELENQQAILGEKLMPLQMAFTNFMIDTAIPMLTDLVGVLDSIGKGFSFWNDIVQDLVGNTNDLVKANKHVGGPGNLDNYMLNNGGRGTRKAFAEGGWAGLNGPEIVQVGERGPEFIRKAGTGTGDGDGGGHGHVIIMDGEMVARAVDRRLETRALFAPSTAERA